MPASAALHSKVSLVAFSSILTSGKAHQVPGPFIVRFFRCIRHSNPAAPMQVSKILQNSTPETNLLTWSGHVHGETTAKRHMKCISDRATSHKNAG